MKTSLKFLIVAGTCVVSTTGFAASNMENPLYMPKNREVYLKTGAAIMYKIAEKTAATARKNTDGMTEFPVWRFTGDMGYGITDRLDVHGRFGYTKDGDIDRKGMHRGRLGLTFRALTESDPIIWDLYADAYLSGITPMKGTYTARGFDFANYSNGRWGAIVGTRFGKTWDKLTLAGHVEYLQTFGNHNNKIGIEPGITPLKGNPRVPSAYQNLTMSQLGFPNEISVDLKSTHETTAGFDAMYQMDEKWSFGGGFQFVEHYNNGVKSIHSKLSNVGAMTTLQQGVVDGLLKETKNMKDGWDEYIIKTNVAYQYTDDIQLVGFFEYTFDDAEPNSQNATDCKMELGVRLNARF